MILTSFFRKPAPNQCRKNFPCSVVVRKWVQSQMQNVAFPSQVIPSLLVAITCNSFETELGLWQKASEQEQGKKHQMKTL